MYTHTTTKHSYKASHVLVDLGWVDLVLGVSPGWWASTVATYCPSRVVEHPKSTSTKPSLRGHRTPCICPGKLIELGTKYKSNTYVMLSHTSFISPVASVIETGSGLSHSTSSSSSISEKGLRDAFRLLSESDSSISVSSEADPWTSPGTKGDGGPLFNSRPIFSPR